LLGRTITFGTRLKGGPCTLRFEADGRISYLHWDPALGPADGTWTVAEDKLCINGARHRCYAPVVSGDRIELFDRHGVMEIDAVALRQ